MKYLLLIIVFIFNLEANQYPYKKEIHMDSVSKPTLVQVALDTKLYKHTAPNYSDIRLYSTQGTEGYFIRSFQSKKIVNSQTLTASSYDRDNATLTYIFKKSFDIEKIELNIEDRNFESRIDIYINNIAIVKNIKIFDYSNETGNRNFSISIPKTKANLLKIVYSLDKTTSFYKKYQKLREPTKYLSIKSVTFSNFNKSIPIFEKRVISLDKKEIKDRESSYIFKVDSIPFSKIEINTIEKNFKRDGTIYISDDTISWRYIKHFTVLSSTINDEVQNIVDIEERSRYIKLEMSDNDNKPLTINQIKLFTSPNYLYFIANPNERYTLYFGKKDLEKPQYEIESLVNRNTDYIKGKFSKIEELKVDVIEKKVSFIEEYKESIFIIVLLFALGVMGYIAFGLLRK